MIKTVLSLATLLSTSLPDYKAEILARTNGGNTYNLPAYASFSSASPSINNAGDVAFSVVSGGIDQFGDNSMKSGVWFKSFQDTDGRIVYYSPENKMIGDAKMLERGDVLFTQFDELSSDGIFAYSSTHQKTENIFQGKNMMAVNYPQALGNSIYAIRSMNAENGRSYFEVQGEKATEIINENKGYSYLFAPHVNEFSQWVFKVRLGERFNYSEEASDQIVLLNPQFTAFGEKSYHKVILAQDADSDILSPYKSFDNSPAISSSGLVVFSANLKNKTRVVVAVKNGQHYIVAREGENDISQIELFSPQINDNGYVVFRAKNSKGLRGIYLADPFKLIPEVKRVLGEGDPIMTDQGLAALLRRDNFPTFGGNVDINNKNEIVFSGVVATENQKYILGAAIYKLHPL